MSDVKVVPLQWSDDPIGEVEFPGKTLVLHHGIGSGLSRDRRDRQFVWAVADRGPNLKRKTAIEDYGWVAPAECDDQPDAKVMPRIEMGPYLAKLRIDGGEVALVEIIRLTDGGGRPVTGCPIPDGLHHQCEPAYQFDGKLIAPDPSGMDTEGVAALADGSFWIAEEYGPSLALVESGGRIVQRLVPRGAGVAGKESWIEDSLPELAARRHLNRGFEGLAASASEDRLYVAFQSPLEHPDKDAFKAARHVRIWELDRGGRVLGQYLYPFDEPDTFLRDHEKGKLGWEDLKICELTAIGERTLLVLERSSETCKIYRVEIAEELRTSASHLDVDTGPTIEELSASSDLDLPVLSKVLLFSSDDHREVAADIEGMTLLSDRSLLIVSDNDFGVEDKETRFFKLNFARPFGETAGKD
jgi:hypothetical protein